MTEHIDDESSEIPDIPVEKRQDSAPESVSDDAASEAVDSSQEPTAVCDDVKQATVEFDESDTRPPAKEPWAIGVSFRQGGKVYYFAPSGVKVRNGDHVLVRTEKGVDMAQVVRILMEDPKTDDHGPAKPLVRKATKEDLAQEEELRRKEREAMKMCAVKIAEHELPMKLVDADYSFDSRSLVFFFSADGRVDFRELVRDLAKVFRTRIELRQIGVRDEAKMLGGIGSCGRPLCCMTFLRNFDAVGIKIAKDQGLSLNPSKISGVCDRLMCCLRYEHEQYCEMRREAPRVGSKVVVPEGYGRVVDVRILTDEVFVELEDGTRAAVKTCQVKRDQRESEPRPTPKQEPAATPDKTEKTSAPKADEPRQSGRERAPERKRRQAWERQPKRDSKPAEKTESKAQAKPEKSDATPTKQNSEQKPDQEKKRARRPRRRRSSGGNRSNNSNSGRNNGGAQGKS